MPKQPQKVSLEFQFVWRCPQCSTVQAHDGVPLPDSQKPAPWESPWGEEAAELCTKPAMVVCADCGQAFDVIPDPPP